MSEKSPRKGHEKKRGKTLKEKQHAKKVNRLLQAGRVSAISATGH
ncbi:hypothetical protein [Actinoplanes solisilvae]|nr:hypothetical protein [Actinoplanes solisilvae]